MTSTSLWMDVDVMPAADSLPGDFACDVAVIGSGIAGLSTAYELILGEKHPWEELYAPGRTPVKAAKT